MSSPHADAAAQAPEPLPRWPEGALQVVGHPVVRASAQAKVTGAARFASDVTRPQMLHAVLVRATVARGRVTRFDAAAARALPGVRGVWGTSDLVWPALPRRERPVIAADVSFVGEEIGVVVADTEAQARHAARLIDVGYDREPACCTLQQALADAAPRLAPAGNVAGGVEVLLRGDLARAQAQAEVVFEASYATPAQHHNCLEPHGCVAQWDGDRLTLWDSNQGVHMIRERLAATLQRPIETVRVVSAFVGGGFGSKIHIKPYHAIAAVVARELGVPVRLFMARREEFVAGHHRAPTERRIRLGAGRDGQLRFVDEQVAGEGGPTPLMAINAAGAGNGLRLHRADAVRAEIRRVLTNTQSPIPFRGPTAAEDLFCLEQAVDELAHALQIDPLQLRLRNLAEVDVLAGLPYAGKELQRCYRLGADAFGWAHRAPRSLREGDGWRGIGMGAVAYDATLYEPSVAEVACIDGGRFEVRVGITEIGGGADTVFAQIAAETLGVSMDRVCTHCGDSATTPRSIDATHHSRTSAVVGPSVRAAAMQLKRLLQQSGAFTFAAPELAALVKSHGALVCSAERERPPPKVFAAMFGAHFVEVSVHARTGRVQVLRAVCAHDAGRVLNPRLAASQVRGGFLQGMGMALQEERVLDARNGMQLNAAMWAYRTPSVVDAPLSVSFVDAGRPDGGNSLGVKGIGEPPLIAAGAAIANAVFNATGARVRDYPITPDKLLAALQEGA
jgi:xanthine dehydrogenase YagR molybdenum-binding subunit